MNISSGVPSNLLPPCSTQLTYQKLESEAAASFDEAAAARAAEEHTLLHSGHGDYADALVGSVEGLHRANIICVRWWPGRGLLATGSGASAGRCVAVHTWHDHACK